MNLSNILPNTSVKNYKEMCKLLEEPVMEGNSKKAQLKDWERFMDYSREGKVGYIIKEIYDIEIPKGVKGDAIYTKFIEMILMNLFLLFDSNSIEATKKDLYHMLGLVNDNYSSGQKRAIAIKEFKSGHESKPNSKLPVLSSHAADFYSKEFFTFTNSRLDKILGDALRSMQKRDLIFYYPVYKIVVLTDDANNPYDTYEASEDEIEKILEIKSAFKEQHPEFKFLNAYNYEKYVAQIGKVYKEKMGWVNVYQTTKIIINEKYLRKNISIVREEILKECQKQKIELNMVTVDKFNQYFEEQYRRNQIKAFNELKDKLFKEMDGLSEDEIISIMGTVDAKSNDYNGKIYKEDYLNIQKELVQLFLKIDNKPLISNNAEEVKTD